VNSPRRRKLNFKKLASWDFRSDACAARESFVRQWRQVDEKVDKLSLKCHYGSVDTVLLIRWLLQWPVFNNLKLPLGFWPPGANFDTRVNVHPRGWTHLSLKERRGEQRLSFLGDNLGDKIHPWGSNLKLKNGLRQNWKSWQSLHLSEPEVLTKFSSFRDGSLLVSGSRDRSMVSWTQKSCLSARDEFFWRKARRQLCA
jgi:hypothetical protein